MVLLRYYCNTRACIHVCRMEMLLDSCNEYYGYCPFSQGCTDDNVDFVMGKTGVTCAGVRDTVTVCTHYRALEYYVLMYNGT